MGLNHSMVLYIPKENFNKATDWLYINTWNPKSKDLYLPDNMISFKTDYFYVNGKEVETTQFKVFQEDINEITVTFCLKFKIDYTIIKFCEGFYGYTREPEKIEDYLLPNNEVWVGGFDTKISLIEELGLYRFEFVAVTSSMSYMIKDSHSVKNWFIQFSKECRSMLSYYNFGEKEKVIYYKNKEILIEFESLFSQNDKNIPSRLVNDFYNYETKFYTGYDFPNYNFKLVKPRKNNNRINIIEGYYYNIYLLGSKWFIEILSRFKDQSVNYRELQIDEIYQFRKNGREYSDELANKYYGIFQKENWKKSLNKNGNN